MFEELNKRRQAVADNIAKSFENDIEKALGAGYDPEGGDGDNVEKARQVGDVHPNGKWVWTQLPSGKFDWRVIKKTSAPSGTSSGTPSSGSASTPAQKQASEGKKKQDAGPSDSEICSMSFEEAKKLGKVDIDAVNAYKIPTTLYGVKRDLHYFKPTGRYAGNGKISNCEYELKSALKRPVGGTLYSKFNSEAEKAAKIREFANKLATNEEIVKRIEKVKSDLNKMKKNFLNSTKEDFTEEEINEWLDKYNDAEEPAAIVKNTWKYSMGRIGSTSLTISVGKSGKEKPFSTSRWDGTVPSWRPIGMMTYTIPSYRGWGSKDSKIRVPIQSWDDIVKHQSDTEDYTIYLYKHPKQ
jgi:hypothetical protein